jgi:Cys-rich repeat protein
VCPPPPPQCTSDADCPTGERCNPICSSTGTAGHECQPDGVPTQICP